MRKKNGFILSATIYSLFIVTVIIIFYILYILTSNKTTVATIKRAVQAETNFEPMGQEIQKSFEYRFIGDYQEFKAPLTGTYRFELWGANSRGNGTNATPAYVKAELDLTAGEILYIYVGEEPTGNYASYNGGGSLSVAADNGYGAGGATDIRFKKGPWYENIDSRIIVAGGAGGAAQGIAASSINVNTNGGNANIINYVDSTCTETNETAPATTDYDGFTLLGGVSGKIADSTKLFGENLPVSKYYNTGDCSQFKGAGGGGYTGGKKGTDAYYSDSNNHYYKRIYSTGGGGGSSFVSTKSWCPALLDSLAVKKTETEYYDFKNVEMKITNIPNAYGEGTNNYHLGNGMVKINYLENPDE